MLSLIFTLKRVGLRNPVIKEELCSQPYEKPVRTRCAKDKLYHYYSLPLAAKSLGDITRLPRVTQSFAQNLLRWQDGNSVTEEDIHALAGWLKDAMLTVKLPTARARVLMQDFTGVPAVVDLAAMRERLNASAAILQRLTRSHRSTWSLTTR
ncbi:hypothetical protein ACLBOM_21055 [Escherichia coli]